ncbi:hypothetical protein GSF70_08730 [Flavobacteriaceae bacterium W22]|nr:hypothetical protein [Flavobacteriaceae bacterium W22]
MSITNLNNTHLNSQQIADAQAAILALENALSAININLTADDRRRYGSINEQNKLFVNKVYDYGKNQPSLAAPEVDWQEFNSDYSSRQVLEGFIARLESLTTRLGNAKILYDYDNFQAALTDYAYTTYKAATSEAGYETKQSDLKQFFAKTSKNTENPSSES